MTVNRTLAPVAALLLSVAILLTGQGLQFALLPVRASLESFHSLAIGIMGAAYFFGFTVGCLGGGELVRRVGHVRVFLAMTAIASAAPLIHVLAVSPIAWALLRMATGFCFATLYIVIESWLNDRATNENRGLVFSTYSMITLSVMAAGQMSMLLYPPTGAELFILASVLVSFGAVPVALSTSPSPELPTKVSIDLRRLIEVSPSGALGCLATGLANGAFWSLAPVFGTRVGGVEMAAVFMTAAVVGGAAAQWPLGVLSDKLGRRKILVAEALVGSIIGIALAMFSSSAGTLPLILLGTLWGAMAFPLYAIAVAYANDFAEPGEHVTLSSGLLLVYGIGATVGPFVASALMGTKEAGSLFSFAAFVHIGLVCFVVIRYLRSGSIAGQPIEFADALALAQTASQIYEEESQNDQKKEPGEEPVNSASDPE
ncbi:MAG: MFS transporter [Woeseiaceae bacterium]|nr:MFS transporter [Woeseiaceae bacterium]